MNSPNSNDETAAALEEVAQTPATLPLKRPTPIFAEAMLPPNIPATQDEAAIVRDEIATPQDKAPVTQDEVSAPQDEASPIRHTPSLVAAPAPLPQVSFSPPPDAPFQSSLTLELHCDVPNTEIRYALNAADVDETGTLYLPSEKIFLPQSASVAARAVVNGQLGPLATAQFQIVQPAWQKIEPLDQSDATPHEIGENSALEGAWKLAAASTRGKLHAHRGLWREDSLAYGLAHAADATYGISIVSDGAGSANLSRVGSKLLCAVALQHLKDGLTQFAPLAADNATLAARDLPILRALLVEAASLALQKLREEAARRQRPLGDFSSTLLILVRREWNGAQLCAALQAGDGAIALWDEDEVLTLLGEADHGQHSSETKFLTTSGMEAELPARVKFSIRPRLRATLVMSDGIADDFFPETARFPVLINQVLPLVAADFAASGETLLKWMRYEKKGSSDDRAMVICWRDDAAKPEPEAQSNAAPGEIAPQTTASSEAATPETSAATNDATATPSDATPSDATPGVVEPTQVDSNAPQQSATVQTDLKTSGAMANPSPSEAETANAAAKPVSQPIADAAMPLHSGAQNTQARRDGEQ